MHASSVVQLTREKGKNAFCRTLVEARSYEKFIAYGNGNNDLFTKQLLRFWMPASGNLRNQTCAGLLVKPL